MSPHIGRFLYRSAVPLALIFLFSTINSFTFSQPDSPRPNIILIVSDDQVAHTVEQMPVLQREIAAKGLVFENAFLTFSLCCPSRATILRGQYAHNHGVMANEPPRGGFQRFYELRRENSTIATWLQAAGYHTSYIGKYLNGYPADNPSYIPPGWDNWHAVWFNDRLKYYNYSFNENGQIVRYGAAEEDYLTDVMTRKVLENINQQQDGPFFMMIGAFAPHNPPIPAPRHAGMFADFTMPRSPAFNEADVRDKPRRIRRRPLLTESEIQQIEANYRSRLETLQAVDEMIGALVTTLEANGQLENTIIIYMTDNGYNFGNHRRRFGKGEVYENQIRTPLIMRGPGIPAGQTRTALVLNNDIAPTLAAFAGVAAPRFVDGSSLLPLIARADTPWRTRFGIDELRYSALRTERYVYVENWRRQGHELYDLQTDPYQLNNIYRRANPRLVARMARQLEALRTCARRACQRAEGFRRSKI